MTMHRPTAFLLGEDVSRRPLPIDPATLSDSGLLARRIEMQAIADDIRDQMQLDNVSVLQRGAEWRNRAHRARQFFLADVRLLIAERDRRSANAARDAKLAAVGLHAKAQQTQHALFVRYVCGPMPPEERAALWDRIRAAFPNDPAWLNGKGAAS